MSISVFRSAQNSDYMSFFEFLAVLILQYAVYQKSS